VVSGRGEHPWYARLHPDSTQYSIKIGCRRIRNSYGD
jgi:hypothetical protein